jgi:hypothetical protein
MCGCRPAIRLALVTATVLIGLPGCGGGGSEGTGPPPPDTLDLAAAYRLTLINNEPLPWHEPPPDDMTYVDEGVITVTPTRFKVNWRGHHVVPGDSALERLDSVVGPYTRIGPTSFSVRLNDERTLDIALDEQSRLLLRHKLWFLGGIYDQIFTAAP